MNRGIWITWEKQRRNQGIASALNFTFFEFDEAANFKKDFFGKLKRYFVSIKKTFEVVSKENPQILAVQVPSIILGVIAYLLSRNRILVFDLHNHPAEVVINQNGFKALIYQKVLSKADYLIITNKYLEERLGKFIPSAKFLILPDALPKIDERGKIEILQNQSDALIITIISSFADDEPIEEIIHGLDSYENLKVFITGRIGKAGDLLKYQSAKINFTDFLSEHDYEALIQHSDLLIDLTTRDDCLVCGAYEALAVAKPIVISDTLINRETFKGAIYAKNNANGIKEAVAKFIEDRDKISILEKKEEFLIEWRQKLEEVKKKIEA